MSEKADINAYFERVGFAGSIAPNLSTLATLHALHPAAIPFENLSVLMNEPVLLDQPSLNRKLLREKRGGLCYEHNFTFMRVLRELDFTVKAHGARTLWNNPEGPLPARNHMLLTVNLDGTNYLADVGFGGRTLTAPLRLRAEVEQDTPHGVFRLMGADPAWRLEAKVGEDWRPMYQFDMTEYLLADAEVASHYVATHPDSSFRQRLMAARVEPGKRHTLNNTSYGIHHGDGEVERRELTSLEEVRDVLAGPFKIAVPTSGVLDEAISRILAAAQ